VEALCEAIGIPLNLADRADHESSVAAAHSALGEEAFAAAWAEGRAMSLEAAVAYALAGGASRSSTNAIRSARLAKVIREMCYHRRREGPPRYAHLQGHV
jgi:hypothetical protein